MAFKLTIEQGRGRGQAFDFEDDEITIGRTEENDVVLFEQGVSRRHSRITFDGSHYYVVDMDSANGTLLNGTKVTREVLEDGDAIGIGAVVFRFDSGPTGPATRVVSEVPDLPAKGKPAAAAPAPRTVAREQPVRAAAPKKPAAAPLAVDTKRTRTLLLAGLAVMLGVIVLMLMRGRADDGRVRCGKGPYALDGATRQVSFGAGETDVECPTGVRFGLQWSRNTRAILHWSSTYTDKGEVALVVNGERLQDVGVAPTARPLSQQVVLPEKSLKEGDNVVEFKYLKGDERWGVRGVELETIGLNEADLTKARQAYELGTKLLQRRNVAARNLYDAWQMLKEARRHMEGLEPKPDLYAPTLSMIKDVEHDLDKLCERKMFDARRLETYDEIDKANDVYRSVLAAFPGDAHDCRQRAAGRIMEE